MSSWRSSKEGDLPLCILEKREIFARNHSATFISSINVQIAAEILKMMRYSLLWKAEISSYDAKSLYFCTWRTPCWLINAFSLKNSTKFLLVKEKIIGRWRRPKRGRFPLLGGRWMLRREMGSKRGSLPPKEGDLTCMDLSSKFHKNPHCSLYTSITIVVDTFIFIPICMSTTQMEC